MCEYVSGEILVSFPNDPELVYLFGLWFEHHGYEEHVRVVERLADRLERRDVPRTARITSPTQLWRVEVPPGQEEAKSTIVRQRLQQAVWQASDHFGKNRTAEFLYRTIGQPNHVLTLNSTAADATGTVVLTDTHITYQALVGLVDDDETDPIPDGGTNLAQRVAIVDTGVTDNLYGRIVRHVDLSAPSTFGRPEEGGAMGDPSLHGTTVASIIADLDDEVELMVYRVGDDKGHTTEFDVIAALLSMADADVVNLSLAFGLDEPDCGSCGRAANSSRSIVFEDALNVLLSTSDPPIVVAAAGNTGASSLSYPARFAGVVAVGAVNSSLEMSRFSNYGTTDQEEAAHDRVWFLPGGDDRPGRDEAPATLDPGDTPMRGTSFACAYASALITRALRDLAADDVVERLRTRDGDPLQDHDPQLHGHGLLTLAVLTEEAP